MERDHQDKGSDDCANKPPVQPNPCDTPGEFSMEHSPGVPSASVYEESQDWAPTLNVGFPSERRVKKKILKKYSDSGRQTDLTMDDLTRLEDAINGLASKISILRNKFENGEFNQEAFEDDEKTRFYTGFTDSASLNKLFQLCEPYIAPTFLSISKFEQFIMVLMRLRLNLHIQDLAYQFKVSAATASQIWVKVVNILHERLKSQIEWPERDVLQSTMPESFRMAFGDKVAVILDCFEVFIKTPVNFSARAQTQANFKHQNTVKFLSVVDPGGNIAYISRSWGGAMSDKLIVEECGVMENLSPGDVVLADRGFNVKNGVGLYCASLKTPTCGRGKKRLSACNSEQAKRLESVRVHVQRVAGQVQRKYQILLNQVVPIEDTDVNSSDSLALIEKIAVVCCALSNLCKSVEPPE